MQECQEMVLNVRLLSNKHSTLRNGLMIIKGAKDYDFSLFPLCVYACSLRGMCVCMCVCPQTCIWRLEQDVGIVSYCLCLIALESGLSASHKLTILGRLAGQKLSELLHSQVFSVFTPQH